MAGANIADNATYIKLFDLLMDEDVLRPKSKMNCGVISTTVTVTICALGRPWKERSCLCVAAPLPKTCRTMSCTKSR